MCLNASKFLYQPLKYVERNACKEVVLISVLLCKISVSMCVHFILHMSSYNFKKRIKTNAQSRILLVR